MTEPRQCGPCHACCVVTAIPELGKAAGEPCKHLDAGRCGIYATRPQTCRDFLCGWLTPGAGYRPDERPDLVQLMVMGQARLKINVAHELAPDASWSWKGQRLLRRQARHAVMGVAEFDKPKTLDSLRLVGPHWMLGQLRAHGRHMLQEAP